jgi:hypothetical protein
LVGHPLEFPMYTRVQLRSLPQSFHITTEVSSYLHPNEYFLELLLVCLKYILQYIRFELRNHRCSLPIIYATHMLTNF